jgi:hypothetical protein
MGHLLYLPYSIKSLSRSSSKGYKIDNAIIK